MLRRVELYERSDPMSPMARWEERQIMIDMLAIEREHIVVDTPAWGGYLAEGIAALVSDTKQIICVEPAPPFAENIDRRFTVYCTKQTQLSLAASSVDRVGSLVGMHHLPDKLVFILEVHRVLRAGGKLCVSEVPLDSSVARFLNGPVNRYTTNGHKGAFVRAGECKWLLETAGFTNVREELHALHWNFSTREHMARFCHGLFGMAKTDPETVLDELEACFPIEETPDGVRMPWALVYCVGDKG